MALIRVEETKGYTVMSNHHLRNRNLSCKAKGLMSLMLALPEDWDYSVKGLCAICVEKESAIRAMLKELEDHGYLERRRVQDENGRFGYEYTLHMMPVATAKPDEKASAALDESASAPCEELPYTENPHTVKPHTENRTQINTNKLKTDRQTYIKQSRYDKFTLYDSDTVLDTILDDSNKDNVTYTEHETDTEYPSYAVDDMAVEKAKQQIGYDDLILSSPFGEVQVINLAVNCIAEMHGASRGVLLDYVLYRPSDMRERAARLLGYHVRYAVKKYLDRNDIIEHPRKYMMAILLESLEVAGGAIVQRFEALKNNLVLAETQGVMGAASS